MGVLFTSQSWPCQESWVGARMWGHHCRLRTCWYSVTGHRTLSQPCCPGPAQGHEDETRLRGSPPLSASLTLHPAISHAHPPALHTPTFSSLADVESLLSLTKTLLLTPGSTYPRSSSAPHLTAFRSQAVCAELHASKLLNLSEHQFIH